MKNLWICLLVVTLLLSCAACGQEAPDAAQSSAPETTTTSTTTTTEVTTTEPTTTTAAPTASNPTAAPTTTIPTTTTTTPIKPVVTDEALLARLDDILATHGSTPLDIYNYVHDNYKYKSAPEKSVAENAQHLLDRKTGSCYHFAALTYLLFQRAGYDVYYVSGLGWQTGTYHCWILANFDGGWYYVDSLYVRSAKLTAADLTRIGYKWDASRFPS